MNQNLHLMAFSREEKPGGRERKMFFIAGKANMAVPDVDKNNL
jgi:hypothetical protein